MAAQRRPKGLVYEIHAEVDAETGRGRLVTPAHDTDARIQPLCVPDAPHKAHGKAKQMNDREQGGEREREQSDPRFVYGPTIIDGYRICGPGCKRPGRRNDGTIFCAKSSNCSDKCSCQLFSRDRKASPQRPESYRHEAAKGTKVQEDRSRRYVCFCVSGLPKSST